MVYLLLHPSYFLFLSYSLLALIVELRKRAVAAGEDAQRQKTGMANDLRIVGQELPQIKAVDMPAIVDIVVLPSDAHAPVLARLVAPLTYPVSCIKKVNVPARQKKFDAYCKTLASSVQNTATSFHGDHYPFVDII